MKLAPDGTVKVLDFGLAKGVTGSAESDVDLAQSPTITGHFTTPGMILGTAAYMSPEQARGKPVDRRTDIFSFGCVLYECLTGRQLFAGETVSDTIAKILEREPDWSALPGSTPEMVRRVLRRCLEKDARKRQRDIGDARLAFEEVEEARTSSIRAAQETEGRGRTGGGSKRHLILAWGIAALAVGFALISGGLPGFFDAETMEPSIRFTVGPPGGVQMVPWTNASAISPDGQSIVWRGHDSDGASFLYLRSLGSTDSRILPGSEDGSVPFWSLDGKSVAFIDGSKLRRLSIEGGDPQAVCDATSTRGGAWGREFIVFAGEQGPLYRVPVSGGTPEPITNLDSARGQTAHRFPHFLPDGETFLYAALPAVSGRITIFAGNVHGRDPVEIISSISGPSYSEGHLIYQHGRRIMAQPFDTEKLVLSGEPVAVGQAPRRPPAVGAPALSASRNGHLAIANVEDLNTELVWLDRSGNILETIDVEPGRYVAPEISPDGRHVALTKKISPEESDIWVLELERMVMIRLTSGPGNHDDAVWSPDGKYIAYSADVDGPWNIFRKPFPGGGQQEPVAVSEATFKNPLDWSPDGKYLLYEQLGTGTNMDLWIAPVDGDGELRPYLEETHQEEQGRFSPDGRWIAYVSHETGKPSTYLNSFPDAGRKYRVSAGTNYLPYWGRRGDEIFFMSGDGEWLMRTSVEMAPFRAGNPQPLILWPQTRSPQFNAAPDGDRILAVQATQAAKPTGITVVLNWASELEE